MTQGRSIDGWLDRRATATFLGVTEWWLEKHHKSAEAPPYVKFGRKSWYRKEDLRTWLIDRKANSLEGLYELGAQPPKAAAPSGPTAEELEAAFVAEHGSTLPLMSATYKRVRREFLLTLSFEQRRIFARLEAS